MTVLGTRLDPRSPSFQANAARMAERLAEVQALQARVVAESAGKQARFDERGQLLPRERVARLLDRGSEFLELSPLAGLGMHDDDGKKSVQGGGSIVGIGVVAGKRVLVSASDSAVKGGTIAPMGLKKALRAQELARENKLPLVSLVESGGANLMYQAEDLRRRRAHLRQPGAAVGRGHSAGRRGARFVHRRRCLPAGPERLRGAGARAQQHLPGRPAAGEGRHRRRRR